MKSTGTVTMALQEYNEMFTELCALRNAVKVVKMEYRNELSLHVDLTTFKEVISKQFEPFKETHNIYEYYREEMEQTLAIVKPEEVEE